VFLGHGGLRGLAAADEFWDEQPYSKRLYYGSGGADYLHRDVLQAALRILDAPTPQGDSGQRDRLVAAISGKVYTKAFREEVLALFDASLPPDLGTGERRG
jgi:hypothetical protein